MKRLLGKRGAGLQPTRNTSLVPLLIITILIFSSVSVSAQSIWTGGGITNLWSDGGNWVAGIVPGNGSQVHFQPVGGVSLMNMPGLSLYEMDMTGFTGSFDLQSSLAVTNEVRLDGTVDLRGNTLTVGTYLEVRGELDPNGAYIDVGTNLTLWGSLIGSGPFDVGNGLLGIAGGSINGTHDFTVYSGDADLTALSTVDMGGSLQMNGGDLFASAGHTFGWVWMYGGAITTTGGAAQIGMLLASYAPVSIENADLDIIYDVGIYNGATLYNTGGAGRVYTVGGFFFVESGCGFDLSADNCELHLATLTTITIEGSASFTIAGGAGDNMIDIVQDGIAGGSRWTLSPDPLASVSISGARVQDGSVSLPVHVTAGVDAGNNNGFTFDHDIDPGATTVTWEAVPLGETSYLPLVVHNRGDLILTVSGMSNTLTQFGASPSSFTVAARDSEVVDIGFTPDAVGAFLDTLVISSDDPDESTVEVVLSGTGGLPDLNAFALIVPQVVSEGSVPFDVTAIILNGGTVGSDSFSVTFRVSTDGVIDTTDMFLATLESEGLLPDSSVIVEQTLALPALAPRGLVYVGYVVDEIDDIPELSEFNNVAAMSVSYPVPLIHSADDVPSDQGGSVFLTWYASSRDPLGDITEYTLWRTIDVGPVAPEGAAFISGPGEWSLELGDKVVRVQETAAGPIFWEYIATQAAFRRDAYGLVVPTMFDSTGTGFQPHYFQVIAHTAAPDTFFLSAAHSGYSVDNLAPAAPQSLVGAQTEAQAMQLSWDPNAETDLSHYAVYRGTASGFVPDPGNRVGEPLDPLFDDGGWRWDGGYYYKVTAIDVNGNESPVATLAPDIVVGTKETGPPRVNYLSQSRPNPFGVETRIEYGLAEATDVSIRIYDVAGRLVRTLVDGRCAADHHSVAWDGRDDAGRVVAGGVYFYRVNAGAFVQTKKMTLLR